jgi:hypothetical protein
MRERIVSLDDPLNRYGSARLICDVGARVAIWPADENAPSSQDKGRFAAEPPSVAGVSVTICRPTISRIECAMRGAVVWHGRRRPRRRFFRISVLRRGNGGSACRVPRVVSFIEGRRAVCRPRRDITRRVCGRWCVIRGTRRPIGRVAILGPNMNVGRRNIDASRRHVDRLRKVACGSLR